MTDHDIIEAVWFAGYNAGKGDSQAFPFGLLPPNRPALYHVACVAWRMGQALAKTS